MTTPTWRPAITAERDAEGRQVAREYAAWHIGDPDWADAIIDAYLMPDSARETLRIEKETEGDTK